VQVLASIDGTPMLEPPAPGKLIPVAATAQGVTLKLPAGFGTGEQDKINKEIKESMQSHFD
jgi:hypothetical protein